MIRVLPSAALLGATLVGAGACDHGPALRSAAVRVDTVGGVVHVRNVGPARVWRIEPELMLRGAGGDEGFGRVVSVLADAAGGIYVADGADQRIHVFGPEGRHLRSMGRRGSGPGEFRDLYSLAWLGDTLAVLDPGNARIAHLTRDGRPSGTWRTQALSGDARVVRLYRAGPRQFFAMGVRPAARGSERVYVRYDPAGPGDTVAAPPFDPRSRRSSIVCHRGDGAITFFDVPFAPSGFTTLAPDAHLVYVWLADYRLTFLGSRGDTVRVVERARHALPISDDEWRAATAEYPEFRRRNAGAQCDPATLPRAAAKPAVRHVMFDYEGRTWVEASTVAGWEWDVFDSFGVLLGTMAAPNRNERVEPFVRNGRLYLVRADTLGQPLVQVYRFTAAP